MKPEDQIAAQQAAELAANIKEELGTDDPKVLEATTPPEQIAENVSDAVNETMTGEDDRDTADEKKIAAENAIIDTSEDLGMEPSQLLDQITNDEELHQALTAIVNSLDEPEDIVILSHFLSLPTELQEYIVDNLDELAAAIEGDQEELMGEAEQTHLFHEDQ